MCKEKKRDLQVSACYRPPPVLDGTSGKPQWVPCQARGRIWRYHQGRAVDGITRERLAGP